ncbi:MAG TPA: phosphate ABC transporter substrate-binding protein PstS [Anaerolineales bacterium]|nr:phosphate ABC transporter substrate-binding protein PstS [Anaerolineales bacterium]HLO32637.1 phosphate ABC transporter substrate-binding protein PstS [Anaerolineales bacterium]
MTKFVRPFMFALIVMSFVLAACGAPSTPAQPVTVIQTQVVEITSTPGPNAGVPATGSIAINGAGATFPYPLYSRWFYDYAFVDPSVKFNYQSIGSGGGIKQITEKTVDFGASDAILNDDQYKAAQGIQMFPTVAGAEAIVVNLLGDDGKPLTTPIKFPYTAVADIYLGKITKWNDPVLTAANPDVKLPDKDIIVVHRSDGSGTTFIFTDYLSKVSQEWKDKVGNSSSVQWPVGLGGKGNEGVYGTVSQNEGAIGYVELAYAVQNKAVLNQLQNKAGEYVAPGADTTQSAIDDFGTQLGDKLALSIVDGPGKTTYPIAGYTYLLLYMDQQDCTKAQKLVDFINWAYGPDGTKDATDLLYAPLPDAVKEQVHTKLSQMTCQGKALEQ